MDKIKRIGAGIKAKEVIMQRRISKAAVIGSGIMGGGIAALLASAGIKTFAFGHCSFDLKEEEKSNPKAQKPDGQGRV
jgi:hypothetical protein